MKAKKKKPERNSALDVFKLEPEQSPPEEPKFKDGIGAEVELSPAIFNFLQTAAQMRYYQKRYFAEKQQKDLIEAKKLETSLDMRLSELGINPVVTSQGKGVS